MHQIASIHSQWKLEAKLAENYTSVHGHTGAIKEKKFKSLQHSKHNAENQMTLFDAFVFSEENYRLYKCSGTNTPHTCWLCVVTVGWQMFSCPDVFNVTVPGKSFDPLIKGRCYVRYRCQIHFFYQFKCKKLQTAAWLECCLLLMFSLFDVYIGSNIRVRGMKRKGRLCPLGVFNQTKVE